MTKQITIKRNGVEGSTSADFVNTQVNGGSADWMPEDEANIGAIRITSNGEYVPSEYGFYGFHMVAVQVPGGAGGRSGPNGEYVVPLPATEVTASVIGVDPVDGAVYRVEIQDVEGVPTLVKTKVADTKADYKPTSIRILLKPAKLSYKVGEKIQYAGLVAELLDSDGHTFVDETFPQGIISWSPVKNLLHPEYDLITPIEYAECSSGEIVNTHSEIDSTKIGFTVTSRIEFRCDHTVVSSPARPIEEHYSTTDPCRAFVLAFVGVDGTTDTSIPSFFILVAANKQQFKYQIYPSSPWDNAHKYTYDGLDVYVMSSGQRSGLREAYYNMSSNVPIVYAEECSSYSEYLRYFDIADRIAWEMLYGDIKGTGTIPVQWNSPYDNQTYEDTFEIEVTDG